MRLLKLLGSICSLILALAALLAATASAALPEALANVKGNTFTGTSNEGTLSAGAFTIKCGKATASGELTGAKTGTGTSDYMECSVLGLSVVSLGDKNSEVLIAGTGTLCYISKATHEVGVLLQLPTGGVHIEVPAISELLLLTGSIVGIISPVNTLTTKGTDEDRKPNARCEGAKSGEDQLLSEKSENKKPELAELVRTVQVVFAKDAEVMA